MAEQEPMTSADPGGRPPTPLPRGTTPGTPGPRSPLRAEQRQAAADEVQVGSFGHGPIAWFRGLGRRGRLAVTGSAAVLAVVAALLALGATSASTPKPTVNHPHAPGFSLAVLGHPGQHVSLAQYAGRPLIINFFASWCAPCQRETPLIARFYRAEHGRVTVLGVDVNDSSSAGLAFVHKTGVGYPVVADPAPMAATLAYGVVALPQTFFLNAQHRIVKRVISAVTLTDLRTGVALLTSQSKRG
jgi:cytochrome c biogenesis protein CcmG, thiol:disulfide interchange protein DsbE